MLLPSRFTVVYDACVLYPASVRDILLQLATTELVRAKWTERIHDEWTENLLENRPEIPRRRLKQTRDRMNRIPDCLVTGFESLERGLDLPDISDRHVLAAAIHCGAQAIVTYNLIDFPDSELQRHNIVAQHPDDFLLDLAELSPEAVQSSVRTILKRLENPPLTVTEYINVMRKNRLEQFADFLGGLEWK